MFRALCMLPVLALSFSAQADDDLGSLLDSIPQIEDKESEAKKKAEAAAAAAERAIDPLAEPSLDEYTGAVQYHVQSRMELPGSVVKKSPEATALVMLKLYSDGSYMGAETVRLSGDKKFDKAVRKAMAAAEPVPGPPVSLRNDAARGIMVELVVE
jgi:phage/plasmid primase-like uncharacterized protein